MRPESDVHLVSKVLQVESASSNEIVLPKALALEAIDELSSRGIAVPGWEAWRRYSDGRLGHGRTVQGAVPLVRKPGQNWTAFIEECREWVRKTIEEEHAASRREPPDRGEMLFCLFLERDE